MSCDGTCSVNCRLSHLHALYMLLQNYTRATRPVQYTSRVGQAINFTRVSHDILDINSPKQLIN